MCLPPQSAGGQISVTRSADRPEWRPLFDSSTVSVRPDPECDVPASEANRRQTPKPSRLAARRSTPTTARGSAAPAYGPHRPPTPIGRRGWPKDKRAISWQVIPTVLGLMLQDKDAGHRRGNGSDTKMDKRAGQTRRALRWAACVSCPSHSEEGYARWREFNGARPSGDGLEVRKLALGLQL
jgi:hypothetical protein